MKRTFRHICLECFTTKCFIVSDHSQTPFDLKNKHNRHSFVCRLIIVNVLYFLWKKKDIWLNKRMICPFKNTILCTVGRFGGLYIFPVFCWIYSLWNVLLLFLPLFFTLLRCFEVKGENSYLKITHGGNMVYPIRIIIFRSTFYFLHKKLD